MGSRPVGRGAVAAPHDDLGRRAAPRRLAQFLVPREGPHVRRGPRGTVRADEKVTPLSRVRGPENKMREFERLLGRKSMESGNLRDALEAACA